MKKSLNLHTNVRDIVKMFKYDQIGAACTPRCGSCKCGNCPPGNKHMTLKEENELIQIEKCLTFKPRGDGHSEQPHWDARYPYLINPNQLPAEENYRAVKAVLFSTLRRLDRDESWRTIYEGQIFEMLERGAARKLSESEINSWTGPVWYIAHQIAPNPMSKTMPCRIVWNSSQPVNGYSLNGILAKGPDVLTPIRCVLLRFREGLYGFLGDISKMYNSVFLEEKEVHLHRFLWPNKEGKIETYVILRVNIGDRPAACLAMLATKLTAQLPEFSSLTGPIETISKSMYVDDILDSADTDDEVQNLQNGVTKILNKGGFKLKMWLKSGTAPDKKEADIVLPNAVKSDESTALGLGYNVGDDYFYVRGAINFSKKLQKMYTGSHLNTNEKEDNMPKPLTKRIVLSQLMSLFDSCGLIAPFKMKGAILFRKTWQHSKVKGDVTDWDEPISPDLVPNWLIFFKEVTEISDVHFPRCLKTESCTKPILITFSDGSDDAFGALVYVRWEADGGYIVRLVEAKGKLCPLNMKGDTVKSEMCGAVFASRLSNFVIENSRYEFSKLYHFIDSMTVLGAINKESYGFSTFYANRVGEIRTHTNPENWYWVASDQNPSDIITRGSSPNELSENSFWQKGPEWLYFPESEWPISQEISEKAQSTVQSFQRKAFSNVMTRSQAAEQTTLKQISEKCLKFSEEELQKINECLRIINFSKFSSVVRTLATVQVLAKAWINRIKPITLNTESKMVMVLKPDQLKAARNMLFSINQIGLNETKLDKLAPIKDEDTGLVVTSGRLGSDTDVDFKVPILQPDYIAKLLAEQCHKRGHCGVDATLVRLRNIAWVLQGRRVVKAIVYQCVICRKNRKSHLNQIIGKVPDFRALPSPPFTYCSVDLFGPMLVRGEVNKRTRAKVWGCVYSCLSTRAIYVDIVQNYGTDAFLIVHRRFQAMRGCCKIIYSDPGKNFVGASNELKRFTESLSKAELINQGAEIGTEWRFHPPDAPHANGAIEIMVKMVKKAVSLSIGNSILSFSELQTVMFEAAELVNERPLAISHTRGNDDMSPNYICPNQILLGRASGRIPPLSCSNVTNLTKRLKYIEEVTDKFWKAWNQLIFPSVVIRPKWHVEVRNLKVGDVVLISNANAVKGDYQLARVSEVYPDDKNRVRQVQVSYKLTGKNPKGFTNVKRDVRRLVLILPVEEQ